VLVTAASSVALQECKRSAVSYISPEHILLAMLNQTEATGKRVLERWAAAAAAASVLRGVCICHNGLHCREHACNGIMVCRAGSSEGTSTTHICSDNVCGDDSTVTVDSGAVHALTYAVGRPAALSTC
jgi:hypothetical protein